MPPKANPYSTHVRKLQPTPTFVKVPIPMKINPGGKK